MEYPTLDKLFGLERERAISDSMVREVFTPHQPISEVELLIGRQREVQKMVATLNTPGQHVLVYGERGVGKSSLANVVTQLLSHFVTKKMFVKRCDRNDTFESILKLPLAEVGADLTLVDVSEQRDRQGGFDFGLVKGQGAKSVVGRYEVSSSLSPSTVAEAIGGLEGLLVVDEADAILTAEKLKLADLMKLLSDMGSRFKVMVVGIASTGSELTGAHPSVSRCLKETKLQRMSDFELRKIVAKGAMKTDLKFTPKVVSQIVKLSAGYPHFTHLIALKCAEEAVAEGRVQIRDGDLREALALAVLDAEGTLTRDYETAIRSASTSQYADIVAAAASLPSQEFSAAELRRAIESHTGVEISQGSLNNFLKRLLSDDEASILRRVAKGVYRFSDPRMASYIRMVNAMIEVE